jgi:hypothetical protein
MGTVTVFLGLYIFTPIILLSYKEFLAALFTWATIIFVFYVFLKPIYNFIKNKIFNYEERYRVQIIERLLWFYYRRVKMDLKQAEEYVNFLEVTYPTASALENWLRGYEEQ